MEIEVNDGLYLKVSVHTKVNDDFFTSENLLTIPETLKFIADNSDEINSNLFIQITALTEDDYLCDDDFTLVH